MTWKQFTIIGVLGVAVLVVFTFACVGFTLFMMGTTSPPSTSQVAVSELPSVTPMQLSTALVSATQVKPTILTQPTPISTNTMQPTNTPQPTLTPTPKPMTPSEELTKLAKDGLEKNSLSMFIRFRSVAIASTTAIVDYETTEMVFDQETAVTPFMHNLENIVPQVFIKFPNVNMLELHQNTSLKDVYGKSSEGVILRVVITRTTNVKINWQSFRPKNLPTVLTGKGDVFYVHPAVSSGWATYQQKY
jgi:hypothetical protein